MSERTRTSSNRRRITGLVVAGLLFVGPVAVAGWLSEDGASDATSAPADEHPSPPDQHLALQPDREPDPSVSAGGLATATPSGPLLLPPRPPRADPDAQGSDDGASTAEGALPEGATIFDDQYPGIHRLDAELLAALREAARVAADAGVEFEVNSGWRSAEYQRRLLRRAIAEYGSEEEARRWVTTPKNSEHVTGNAVDLGVQARRWLAQHGAAYGLCQIYANEPWHFELRPGAVDHGCPEMYADAAHDPRTQP